MEKWQGNIAKNHVEREGDRVVTSLENTICHSMLHVLPLGVSFLLSDKIPPALPNVLWLQNELAPIVHSVIVLFMLKFLMYTSYINEIHFTKYLLSSYCTSSSCIYRDKYYTFHVLRMFNIQINK